MNKIIILLTITLSLYITNTFGMKIKECDKDKEICSCLEGETCICSNEECNFEKLSKNSRVICTNKVGVCSVVCKKDECENVKSYSGASVTNIVCSEDKAGKSMTVKIIDKLINELNNIDILTDNDFKGIKTSGNIYCTAKENCSKMNILLDAEFIEQPVISATGENALKEGKAICYRNICECVDCSIKTEMILEPKKDDKRKEINIPKTVSNFKMICQDKDSCKDILVNSESEIVDIICNEFTCENLKMNLNYIQSNKNKGKVLIDCGGCLKSNIKINGKYSSVNINGRNNDKSLGHAIVTGLMSDNSCNVNCGRDKDNKIIGCKDILVKNCKCKDCEKTQNKREQLNIKTLTKDDTICDNTIGMCVIDCKNDDCKKKVFISSAKNTIITCFKSSCEESHFHIGDQDDKEINEYKLDKKKFTGNYESYIMNCDEEGSCKKATMHINGKFKSVIISGSDSDSLSESKINCNINQPSFCMVNCGKNSCGEKLICDKQCQCKDTDLDNPSCPNNFKDYVPINKIIDGEEGMEYTCDDDVSFCMLNCGTKKEQCKGVILNTYAKLTNILCLNEKSCAELQINGKTNKNNKIFNEINLTCSRDNSISCEKIKIDVDGNFKIVNIIAEGNKVIKEPKINCISKNNGVCNLICNKNGCESIKKELINGVTCQGEGCPNE